MNHFSRNLKRALFPVLYMVFYLSWFFKIENMQVEKRTLIHVSYDDQIPFIEYFVVPYFLWFLYIAGTILYFFFHDRNDYIKVCTFLFTGMTVFLIVSTLWPNGHNLRPVVFPRDNLFTRLVQFLYTIDTPTNLWPSIHVYNSIGCHIAIRNCKDFKDRKWIVRCSFLLMVSIIAATVFLKQHSLFDVCTAFLMAAVFHLIIYRCNLIIAWKEAFSSYRNHHKLRMQ